MSFQDIEQGPTQPLLDNKQEPSKAVAAGIFQINTSVSSFKRLVNTLGTPKDTPELREKLYVAFNNTLVNVNCLFLFMVAIREFIYLLRHTLAISIFTFVCNLHLQLDYVGEFYERFESLLLVGEYLNPGFLDSLVAKFSYPTLWKETGIGKGCLKIRQPKSGINYQKHRTRLHIVQLATETSAKLKAASDTDHVTEANPGKKIADAKLAKDYQAVLQEFQKAQRTAAERETAYTPFVPQAVLPSTYTAGELNLPAEDAQAQEHRALLVEQRRQEVIFLENEIVFNEALIEERDQGIREIQQQIGEVNEIFKDLAVLVHEQGVMIDDIDTNIETSHAATAQANRQLTNAAKSQKSNSSLACLLLVIFGVVLLIVIIVLAT
ncbi:hypothetical protein L7F22_022582 [Adiantum nelumboides]|nr:hypothetical protein [Adiantum nelumboides]